MAVEEELSNWPLGRLLSTAARRVEHAWNAVLADRDLTHAGLLVLHALATGPATQRELARASRVEEQTMARTVERLERTGHVRRDRDLDDRRRLKVSMTALGNRTWRELSGTDVAERLVADQLVDPDRFRAELIRLLDGLNRPLPTEEHIS